MACIYATGSRLRAEQYVKTYILYHAAQRVHCYETDTLKIHLAIGRVM
jgi:hypothetical protein